jgi:uncharacterized protein
MKKEVCLVTGASSGLGKALVETLCEKNYIIYITARSKEELDKIKKECSKSRIEVIAGDISEIKFRENLIKEIVKKEGRIDFLFNNAGFGELTRLEYQKPEKIESMFKVNVVAYIHLASLVLKQMKKQNFGRIINIGSVVAITPLPFFTTYDATKAAVYTFNRTLRYELKETNIKSTVVLPARMKTNFFNRAIDCDGVENKKKCIEKFNKVAGSPYQVADVIVRKMYKGKEVITPTWNSKVYYLMRYFGFATDFVMKNILGPKQAKDLK